MLSVWGFVLGAIVAVIYFYQLIVMHDQFTVMQGQLAVLQQDQRAWVKVSLDHIPLQAMSSKIGTLTITNIGKTPARILNGIIAIRTLARNEAPDMKYDNGPWKKYFVPIVFPSDKPDKMSELPLDRLHQLQVGRPIPDPLSQDEMDQFNQGNLFLVVYMRFTYRDTFGEHWTQFCVPISVGKGESIPSRPCVDYNDADSN